MIQGLRRRLVGRSDSDESSDLLIQRVIRFDELEEQD
ncbi:MAG: hypothetical protein UT42_C0035G0003 [Candidatus Falkowbacteria bacterium GW2011_GWA2_39_24]|uniref:Uncharacterized protein n=1 Tax=Candidatus Falkowbacteria bacterium GW2011_GWA2_39_24 TaxID=1618634 RepID=A0A0G0NCQ5_9BACT|nr:MAG: hypothetical protein UT22_C0033G0002 [Parcubacteria group bacterium GW2011_GWC2_39_11]KKR13949.1 MAG: hypothetical protein UT42_C0035G0003 [Candidatus Falkowbacteria bacterium GW2011_GWA2_39_24]